MEGDSGCIIDSILFCQSLARFLETTSPSPNTGGIPSLDGVALSGQGTLAKPEISVVISVFNFYFGTKPEGLPGPNGFNRL